MEDEIKMQYILDENKKLVQIPKSECVPVENPVKYRVKNAFEVFVKVIDTENYWISNYGKCINNLRSKDGSTFYEHKQGNVHYTVFEIVRYPEKNRRGKLTGKTIEEKYRIETSPAELVGKHFLKKYEGRNRVWHKDGDKDNNWYKNLIYVSANDYKDLTAGKVLLEDLDLEQEYIEYENRANTMAYKVYHTILSRCGGNTGKNVRDCYMDTTMCQFWLKYPEEFVKWYLHGYYEVDGESMAVDKDLFGNGANEYSPENCCILPQILNTMLSNCKKPYFTDSTNYILPLGVKYSSGSGKYYGEIKFASTGERKKLCEWDTPEEAFAEYKKLKEADVKLMAAKYKNIIPEYIYKKLLEVEVQPY